MIHTYYVNIYNVEILNSFSPELQIKHTDSVKKNKLKILLAELRGFIFVTTLVLKLKKQRTMMKQSIALFIQAIMLK